MARAPQWQSSLLDSDQDHIEKFLQLIRETTQRQVNELIRTADEDYRTASLGQDKSQELEDAHKKKVKEIDSNLKALNSEAQLLKQKKIQRGMRDQVDSVYDRVATQLQEHVGQPEYSATLVRLLKQAYDVLGEPELSVRVRTGDMLVAAAAVATAAEELKEDGKDVSFTIEDKEFALSNDRIGGVFVTGGKGKITTDNTFAARLEQFKTECESVVRDSLFGQNPDRKFFS